MDAKITGADFFGDKPPERIIGTETETNLIVPFTDEFYDIEREESVARIGRKSVSGFLDNGMRVYVDSDLLEVCSAEALGPLEAAHAEQAAINVLGELVDNSGLEHEGLYRSSGSATMDGVETQGYHENYLVPADVAHAGLMQEVVYSMAASRLYAMSGLVDRRGFRISQKVTGMNRRPTPLHDRKLKNTVNGSKDLAMIHEGYSAPEEFDRLEVRMADPGFNFNARFLGVAAMSLALRVVEHPELADVDELLDKSFAEPVYTSIRTGRDMSFSTTDITNDGSQLTPLDYQELVLESAQDLAERIELPEDELKAMELWQKTIDAMRDSDIPNGDYGDTIDYTHFALRHAVLARRFGVDGIRISNPGVHELSTKWDRIRPVGPGVIANERLVATSPYLNPAEVKKLEQTPPLGTMAYPRGEQIGQMFGDIKSINWAEFRLHGDHMHEYYFHDSPYFLEEDEEKY